MSVPITGKDVKVELLVNGVPAKLIDQVVSFTEDEMSDVIESEHLGTDDVDVEKRPKGWGGTIEINRKAKGLDDMIDAHNLAQRNNVPTLFVITRTYYFQDGTFKTNIYPAVVIHGFGTTSQRGQNVRTRFTWRCGRERI